jgi:hypothetical protein
VEAVNEGQPSMSASVAPPRRRPREVRTSPGEHLGSE